MQLSTKILFKSNNKIILSNKIDVLFLKFYYDNFSNYFVKKNLEGYSNKLNFNANNSGIPAIDKTLKEAYIEYAKNNKISNRYETVVIILEYNGTDTITAKFFSKAFNNKLIVDIVQKYTYDYKYDYMEGNKYSIFALPKYVSENNFNLIIMHYCLGYSFENDIEKIWSCSIKVCSDFIDSINKLGSIVKQ